MKKEIDGLVLWVGELVSKYGFLAMIVIIIWVGIKRVWFWIVMPILLAYALSELGVISLPIKAIIASWVFIFTILKGVGNVFFEKN